MSCFWSLQVQHRAQPVQSLPVSGRLYGGSEQPLLSAVWCLPHARTTECWRGLERGCPQTGKSHCKLFIIVLILCDKEVSIPQSNIYYILMYLCLRSVLCPTLKQRELSNLWENVQQTSIFERSKF